MFTQLLTQQIFNFSNKMVMKYELLEYKHVFMQFPNTGRYYCCYVEILEKSTTIYVTKEIL